MKSVNGKINEGGISKVLHQGAQLLPEMARRVVQMLLEAALDKLKCPRSLNMAARSPLLCSALAPASGCWVPIDKFLFPTDLSGDYAF